MRFRFVGYYTLMAIGFFQNGHIRFGSFSAKRYIIPAQFAEKSSQSECNFLSPEIMGSKKGTLALHKRFLHTIKRIILSDS